MSINWGQMIENAGDVTEFDVLPPGDYEVSIDESEATTSTTKKTMFKVRFNIEEGPFKGRKAWNNFVVSEDKPNALAWFFKNMATLGLGADFFKAQPTNDQVARALMGRRCRIQVAHRQWQGQIQADVKKVMPSGAGAGSVPPPPSVGAVPPPPPIAAAAPAPSIPPPPPVAAPTPVATEEVPPPPPVAAPAPVEAPAPAPTADASLPPAPPF